MELRPPLSSSDKRAYALAGQRIPAEALSLSAEPPIGKNFNNDVASAPTAVEVTARTVVADPVVVGVGGQDTAPDVPAGEPLAAQTHSTAMEAGGPPITETEPGSPPTHTDGPRLVKPVEGAGPTVRCTNLRPTRLRRVRMRYLMQAWSVSLLVHVVILSALAAATFTAKDTVKKILNFDSALAGFQNGEQEVLPIYADPDNIRRDKALG